MTGTLLFSGSCRRDNAEPNEVGTHVSVLDVPPGFPLPYLSVENPQTAEGVALGRKLYYDTLLSLGGPQQGRSCASCHLQSAGFTKPDMPVLAHVNLAWSTNFLWKGEISGSLEDIMRFEVNDFFASDLSGLLQDASYPALYQAAFGETLISPDRTAFALAQFVRTQISGNALFDRFIQKKADLPDDAKRGYELFYSEKGDCFHCHGNALFTDNGFHNIGLRTRSGADAGRYLVTGSASDMGKFKTPSLRNTALRGVYMHDGRFKTLEEVVNHYASGIQYSAYLDPILDKRNISLSPDDVSDLVAFLKTLTDTAFLKNPKLSKP